MTCALPPLDMRFARVVAKTSRGMDFMYFEPDGRPRSEPVVSPIPRRSEVQEREALG